VSPANNRPDVDDVILIITDGEPYGNVDNIIEETVKNANIAKEKNIKIVAAAVGNEGVRKTFKPTIDRIATSDKLVVEADFNSIDKIRPMLISKTCSKPGTYIDISHLVGIFVFGTGDGCIKK
jgi:uncharacterized protein YegL